MNRTPKVAAVQDLSGLGRCSLSVVLPVLSVMGAQCCPLPTAVLSAHTAFPAPEVAAFQDLTGAMEQTLRHWEALHTSFDAIYSGFLGSPQQIGVLRRLIQRFRRKETLVLIDPVMGDHGRVYRTYTPEMCEQMIQLAAEADLITPNLTEAAILLGLAPDALLDQRGEDLAVELSGQGQRSVVVTGVTPEPGYTGAVWFDHTTGASGTTVAVRAPGEYPGTGDLFAAVLTGSLVMGESLERGVSRAAHFITRCASYTAALGTDVREGVLFEPLLPLLLGDALAMDDRI